MSGSSSSSSSSPQTASAISPTAGSSNIGGDTAQSSALDIVSAPPEPKLLLGFLKPEIASYFVAGGCAGAASRTVVSPLERLKIIQQVQPRTSEQQYKGVWQSLARMWREEGFKGFMRGNGINCLRIVPYSAVQFTTYEQLKKWFTSDGTAQLDTPTRLMSGALAGITSVCSTYPLDLVRSRLSIATASIPNVAKATPTQSIPSATPALASAYHTSSAIQGAATVPPSTLSQSPVIALTAGKPAPPKSVTAQVTPSVSGMAAARQLTATYTAVDLTILGMTLKIMREEGGVRALYRGLVTTAVGVAPYVGINFAAYELLRGIVTPPGNVTIPRKLACGALAGSISQTLTYPFDVLRRKMQVTGMASNALGIKYNGALDALTSILRNEGVRGLYHGLWPNLLKVAPSIATSFFTYELVKDFLLA